MQACRGCNGDDLRTVLDIGAVPAADFFPPANSHVTATESTHRLSMVMCGTCALAQLADDDTVTQEPRGVEPQALRDQAAEAVRQVGAAGWLMGDTVIEFGSPHGGTWVPLLRDRGFRTVEPGSAASVVLDCFGIMHEPNQREAFRRRAAATATDGILLLQFHSLSTIVRDGQWNALRHGHFAYYSLHALTHLLAEVGMSAVGAWEFELYGGTVLIAARHGRGSAPESVVAILEAEQEMGICQTDIVATLQDALDCQVNALHTWLVAEATAGHRVFGYSAASRAVALLCRAKIDRRLLHGVADASPAKHGRRMPGTDIPIISPQELLSARPDRVYLMLPDLLPEVSRQFAALDGRWMVDPGSGGSGQTTYPVPPHCPSAI